MNGTVVLIRSENALWETYFLSMGEKLGWKSHETHRDAVEAFIWTNQHFQ